MGSLRGWLVVKNAFSPKEPFVKHFGSDFHTFQKPGHVNLQPWQIRLLVPEPAAPMVLKSQAAEAGDFVFGRLPFRRYPGG